MPTEFPPLPYPDNSAEARLLRRFALEMTDAERDYPRMSWTRARRGVVVTRRRAALPLAALVLLVAAVSGWQLPFFRGSAGPAGTIGPSQGPSAGDVVLAADGLPASIDGERVFRPGDAAEWWALKGSFLVAGSVDIRQYVGRCAAIVVHSPEAGGSSGATSTADAKANRLLAPGQPCADPAYDIMLVSGADATRLARTGADLPQADQVVVRAHTGDPRAADCSAWARAGCAMTVVPEDVVWRQSLPASFAGRDIVRLANLQGSLPSGEQPIGGVLTRNDGACVAVPTSGSEASLIGSCGGFELDGVPIAPASQVPATALGRTVVVLGHAHDQLAATCSADYRDWCEQSIVVDSVVWPDDLVRQPATPSVRDAIPSLIGGERVYTPADRSTWSAIAGSFLVAGVATDHRHATNDCPIAGGSGDYPLWAPTVPAEARLLPVTGVCDGRSVRQLAFGGEVVSLAESGPALPEGELVVLRVHLGDPSAAECGAARRGLCAGAVVAESISWRGGRWVVLGNDGLPQTLGTETVYRASNVPHEGIVLLAGTVERSQRDCSTDSIRLYGCATWTVGGLRINGTLAYALEGQPVVVRVFWQHSQVSVDCADPPCSADYAWLVDVVWQAAEPPAGSS